MKPSNFTNSSGAMSNLIKLLPNGLNSQFSSLSDPQATPTTNVDNSFPFPIAPFIAVTATVCATVGVVVCGARFLYNRINSRRANGDDNIELAVVTQNGPPRGLIIDEREVNNDSTRIGQAPATAVSTLHSRATDIGPSNRTGGSINV